MPETQRGPKEPYSEYFHFDPEPDSNIADSPHAKNTALPDDAEAQLLSWFEKGAHVCGGDVSLVGALLWAMRSTGSKLVRFPPSYMDKLRDLDVDYFGLACALHDAGLLAESWYDADLIFAICLEGPPSSEPSAEEEHLE